MATPDEIAAFEGFQFRIGQKVQTKLPGFETGLIVERALQEDSGGVKRVYCVRHGPVVHQMYREFELEARL